MVVIEALMFLMDKSSVVEVPSSIWSAILVCGKDLEIRLNTFRANNVPLLDFGETDQE